MKSTILYPRSIVLIANLVFVAIVVLVGTGVCLRYDGRSAPKMAGLSVGRDTESNAEEIFGAGASVTGAHPGSALIWRSKQTGLYLVVDGFHYIGRGKTATYIIDEIQICKSPWDVPARSIPTIDLNRRQCSLLGKIGIGTEKSVVLRTAREHGFMPQVGSSELSWSESANIRPVKWLVFKSWTASVEFDSRSRVDRIVVTTGGDLASSGPMYTP